MARALLLCLLLLGCCCSFSAAGRQERSSAVVPTSTVRTTDAASPVASSSNSAAVLPLAHRWRRPGSTKQAPSLAERLRRDEARRSHIMGRTASDEGIPLELGSALDTLEYVVTVGLGTPPVPQTVLVDSGSDFNWVQCAPCESGKCHPQQEPLFNPRRSSTYAPVPCDSAACRAIALDEGNGCTEDAQCGFTLWYADTSNTTGVYGTDTLTLAPSAAAAVEGFRFGCGHDQGGFDDEETAGLLGLGDSPESLVAQASPASGGAFSYCLPPTSGSPGFLALGAPGDTSGFVFTPMHPSDHIAVFYKVTLTGISVAGRPLDVPPSVLPHGDFGMILDSGSVITELPAAAYAALRAEFRRAMAAYPPAPPVGRVDTCYNLTGFTNVTVPSVSLTFLGGATIDLDVPNGILVEGCLAFVGLNYTGNETGNGGIGNVNQRTFEVLYDPPHGRVGFRPRAC